MSKLQKNKLLPVADQVIHAYSVEDVPMRKIANFFSVSTGTVRNLLLLKEVSIRPKGRRPKKQENV